MVDEKILIVYKTNKTTISVLVCETWRLPVDGCQDFYISSFFKAFRRIKQTLYVKIRSKSVSHEKYIVVNCSTFRPVKPTQ